MEEKRPKVIFPKKKERNADKKDYMMGEEKLSKSPMRLHMKKR